MGLDTYASLVPGEISVPDQAKEEFSRIDGIDDSEYFRGNLVYKAFRDLAGIDILKEWTPPEEVQVLRDAFGKMTIAEAEDPFLKGRVGGAWGYLAIGFYRFFSICVEYGLGLVGRY